MGGLFRVLRRRIESGLEVFGGPLLGTELLGDQVQFEQRLGDPDIVVLQRTALHGRTPPEQQHQRVIRTLRLLQLARLPVDLAEQVLQLHVAHVHLHAAFPTA